MIAKAVIRFTSWLLSFRLCECCGRRSFSEAPRRARGVSCLDCDVDGGCENCHTRRGA